MKEREKKEVRGREKEKNSTAASSKFVKRKQKAPHSPSSPLSLRAILIRALTSAPIETIGAKIGSRGERPRAKNCLFFF